MDHCRSCQAVVLVGPRGAGLRYRSHFATCPQAAAHRKVRGAPMPDPESERTS